MACMTPRASSLRLLLRTCLPGALVVLSACADVQPQPVNAGREMDRARRHADALVRQAAGNPVTVDEAVALGYLERLRLGLGSPFRLVELALTDPRLPEHERSRVAWALLARAQDGRSYEIDPAALDGLAPTGSAPGAGAAHLALIDETMRDAADPAAAELALRLAYAAAAAEGTVSPAALRRAAKAALLLHDRRTAREDVGRLLAQARQEHLSPLEMLPAWRGARRFRVEAPTLRRHDARTEQDAAGMVPQLMVRIRLAEAVSPEARAVHQTAWVETLLSPWAAATLGIATEGTYPPLAPLVTAVAGYRGALAGSAASVLWGEAGRRLAAAGTEEEFVAARAELVAGAADPWIPARAALTAAVAMRPYAQEPVWHPGFPAPAEREVTARFGLASIRFDDDVPTAWRGYHLRMIEHALGDLQLVFPGVSLKGLAIRIGAHGRADALATHSPRTRTITLPVESGAGTIAHEVAHDLDWQAALARYRVRGDYRTDRALRSGRDPMAAALRDLTAAAGDSGTFATRPAELFARSVDWLVAGSLARRGRMNGYLTAAIDDVLPGYGAALPPAPGGRMGEAVLRIVSEIAAINTKDEAWYLKRHGTGAGPAAWDLVRLVLEAPLPAVQPVAEADPHSLRALLGGQPPPSPVSQLPAAAAGRLCVSFAERPDAADVEWRTRLAALFLAARARGEALEQAQSLAGGSGRSWMKGRLYGPGWTAVPMDSATAEILEPIMRRVELAEMPRGGGVLEALLDGPAQTRSAGPCVPPAGAG
jgi:hypothetical protein